MGRGKMPSNISKCVATQRNQTLFPFGARVLWDALMQSPSDLVTAKVERVDLQMEVLREIRKQLAPYQVAETPITGDTVICDGTTVDSLTVMDMIVELEDRFDVSIPIKRIADIRTVNELADTIMALCTPRQGSLAQA